MRKHMYLITEHDDESQVGGVRFTESPHASVTKNEEGVVDMRNIKTGETWSFTAVGLGYHDFEDEEHYRENALTVAKRKLREIDDSHLEKAGVELEEVPA